MESDNVVLTSRITAILAVASPSSATRQFADWFEKENKKGLLWIRFNCLTSIPNPQFLSDSDLTLAIEERANEFMRMVTAPDLPDEEVLGKYSPL